MVKDDDDDTRSWWIDEFYTVTMTADNQWE